MVFQIIFSVTAIFFANQRREALINPQCPNFLMDRADWIFFGLKNLAVGGPEGGSRAFQVTLDEFMVTFKAGSGRIGFLCEASSNATLAPKFALKPDQEAAFRAEGFIDSEENRSFTLTIENLDPETLQDLATKTIRLFQEIYRCSADCAWEFSFYLEDPRPPSALQYLVATHLTQFLSEQSKNNLFLIESGKIYAQFSLKSGFTPLTCEVVANRYLPPDLQLPPEKVDLLTSRGFEAPAGDGNFHRDFAAGNFQELIEVVRDIFGVFLKVYSLDALPRFKLTIALDGI